MYPVLFKIPILGGITIYSYGLMVAMGFFAGMLWIGYESRRVGQDPRRAMDLLFFIILAGIIGSRIFHVAISEWDVFKENPLMILRIWEGGLVFYGGVIAAFAVTVWYVHRYRMSLFLTFDVFAPALSIGHAIGRIGCFLAGCCFGREVGHEAWYAVTFPEVPKTFAPTGIALYPTQLLEAVGELLIFLFLVSLRKYKRFDGQIMGTYLILYAVLRFFIEFLRGDPERGFLAGDWLSTSQFISLITFVAGVLFYLLLWPKKKECLLKENKL